MTLIMRDKSVDILKGIGIILVVVGHANCPQTLRDIIYSFHMPLFFICSGFFFSLTDTDNWKKFLERRVKRLYIPFVKWSIFFLLLHNLFYSAGILNSDYGNIHGETSSIYSLNEIISRFLNILFRMSGYEPFILGAFWFMRALFVGSIFLFCLVWLMRKLGALGGFSIGLASLLMFCVGGGYFFI